MVALPYDWRLSLQNLEARDAYYSRLRSQVQNFSACSAFVLSGVYMFEFASFMPCACRAGSRDDGVVPLD